MVVNDFDYQLPQDGINNTSTHQIQREKSWRVMFPEATQYDDTIIDKLTTDLEDDNYRNHVTHNNNQGHIEHVISIDAIDAINSYIISTESISTSSLSTSSSEGDLVFHGEQLFKHSNVAKTPIFEDTKNTNESRSYLDPQEITKKVDIHTAIEHPPTQEMRRDENEGYDVERIPASVFNRSNSISPGEWSVASNESLFSLHVGSTSIGRDQAVSLSGELKKNGELPKSHEFRTGELNESKRPPLPTRQGKSSVTASPKILINVDEESTEMILMGKDDGKKQHRPSVHSTTSEDSNYSFAFPLLDEGEKNATPKRPNNQALHPKGGVLRNKFCFLCFPCFSCCSILFSYFSACFSCKSCFSCFSCKACFSCFSCNSCSSCFSCKTCPSCLSCISCHSCTSYSLCKLCSRWSSCSSCCLRSSCISCQNCGFFSCCSRKSLSLKCC